MAGAHQEQDAMNYEPISKVLHSLGFGLCVFVLILIVCALLRLAVGCMTVPMLAERPVAVLER